VQKPVKLHQFDRGTEEAKNGMQFNAVRPVDSIHRKSDRSASVSSGSFRFTFAIWTITVFASFL